MQRNAETALALFVGAVVTLWGLNQSLAAEPTKPPVAVFGVNAGKAAFSNVAQPDVKIPLTIENMSGKALEDISIELSPFTAATGDVIEARMEPGKVPKVPPGATAQFKLLAQFLPAATFSAHARVLQGKKVLSSFEIEIVRIKAKPQMDIGDVAVIQETAGVLRESVDIPLTMKVYSTGATAIVTPPILHSAIRKPKVDSISGIAAVATLDLSALPNPLVVTAGQPRDITLRLRGITAPGRYDLKLRFAPPGYDVIDKDVTIYVRDPSWVATAFIFVGVVLSLLFQAYGGTIRPRLVVKRRVESVFVALREIEASAPENDTKQLAADVSKSLAEQWQKARDRGGLAAASVDAYEQMIPGLRRWSEMRHLVAATRPDAVRQRLTAKLAEAAATFSAASPDAAKISSSIDTLQKFPDTIRTETVQELTSQLDMLDKELTDDARPTAARLRSALLLVREKLHKGALEAAVGAFDAARLQYAVVLADDLIKRVDSNDPPIGISNKDWGSLVEETKLAAAKVQRSSDADDAMAKIASAMKNYLFRVAGALRTAAGALGDSATAKAVTDELDSVETAIQANQLTDAWQHMNAAAGAFQRASVPVGRPMGETERTAFNLLDVLAGRGAVGGSAFDIMGVFDVPSAADLVQPGAPARTARRLNRFDFLASAFALIIATAIGLQALWIDNPVWGGGAFYFAAFIWGFAVDQFTHAGIVALRPR
jgi:hypothetical protein